jgi:UDP-GlcNAc:undecaprenyl-phosphate GlcNAc-1-phosphate transferase
MLSELKYGFDGALGMTLMLSLTFGLALLLSLYGVPIAKRAALKYRIVDVPDGRLKHQREPVPYLGGLAMYLAFLVSLAFTFAFRQDVLGIVLAGTLVMMLGLIDDFGELTPLTKLAGQLLAVFVLIKSGVRIQIAALPDWLCLTLTIVWMVGLINAFNLLDVMDGLSAGIGLIGSVFLLMVAVYTGDMTIAFMLAALAGSVLGFLRYNTHPAQIYMGDAGALFLGLMLGALAMTGTYPGGHQIAVLSPVLILGVPIFDTLFVMYIRYRRGLPIFLGSPDHIAIRLRHWGLTVPQVVAISYAATMIMGTVGVLVTVLPEKSALLLVIGTLLALGLITALVKRVNVAAQSPSRLRPAAAVAPSTRRDSPL